jgi:undecaprenyl diphosphate synthase
MNLRVAVDYSSQYSILRAAQLATRHCAADAELSADDFERSLHDVDHSARPTGPVDLLIRTGNERRLSDFMLWECAYAELYFSDCLWPEFDEARFRRALSDYAGRQRRFGGLTAKGGDPT